MRAFIAGAVVAILLGVAAGFALEWLDWSSANVYRSENVRL